MVLFIIPQNSVTSKKLLYKYSFYETNSQTRSSIYIAIMLS